MYGGLNPTSVWEDGGIFVTFSFPCGSIPHHSWAGWINALLHNVYLLISAQVIDKNLATPRPLEDRTKCVNLIWIGICQIKARLPVFLVDSYLYSAFFFFFHIVCFSSRGKTLVISKNWGAGHFNIPSRIAVCVGVWNDL